MQINQSPIRFGFATLLLAGFLTACPATSGGGSGGATVSSVTISGAPSDNNLKINAPVTLTATAKDSSGASISGTTFTWVSSNPDAVSVDAGGVVTAKKFGDAIITASSGTISAATSSIKTYGLEAIGGTRTSNGDTNIGTSVFLRFRKANGSAPNTNSVVSVAGPSDWNGGTALAISTGSGWQNWWYSRTNIIGKSGKYTASATIDGETYSSSFAIDATKTIASPTNLTASNISSNSLTGTWSAVTGAAGYLFEVWNKTDGNNAGNVYAYTNVLTSTPSGFGLTKGKTYYAQTHSFNFIPDTAFTGFAVALPAQFNVGFVTSSEFTGP